MLRTTLCAAALTCALTNSSLAALTAYDGFNYTAGADLAGLNGGTGWGGPWTFNGLSSAVAPASLQYAGLVFEGNAVDTSGNTPGTTRDFRLVGPFNAGNTSDLWISFLAQAVDTTATTQFFGITTYNGNETASQLSLQRLGDGSNEWGIVGNNAALSADVSSDVVVTPGETVLIVAHLDYDTGGGAVAATFYLNPTVGAGIPAESDGVITGPAGSLDFDRIRFASANGLNWLYDEVRLGTTITDVTPLNPPDPDVDGENGVDFADFEIIRDNYLTGTTHALGDVNFDAKVDHLDFFAWRTAFESLGGVVDGLAIVPEPATGATCFMMVLVASQLRMRKQLRVVEK
jgi:hypothetical protein